MVGELSKQRLLGIPKRKWLLLLLKEQTYRKFKKIKNMVNQDEGELFDQYGRKKIFKVTDWI